MVVSDGFGENITFSAMEEHIEIGRQRAKAENTTLNAQFRIWLENYTQSNFKTVRAKQVMTELKGQLRFGQNLT